MGVNNRRCLKGTEALHIHKSLCRELFFAFVMTHIVMPFERKSSIGFHIWLGLDNHLSGASL